METLFKRFIDVMSFEFSLKIAAGKLHNIAPSGSPRSSVFV
jgi:hypothetical protein